MICRNAIALALLVVALPAGGGAQSRPAPAAPDTAARPSHGCFRGRPIDRCATFWLTESGLHYRIVAPASSGKLMLAYTLGVMVNRSPRTALGGELFASAEEDLPRLGVALRWRRWLSRTSSLDVTTGVHLAGVPFGSPTVQVKLTSADLVGVSARYDYLRTAPGCAPPYCTPAGSRLYLGAEFGAQAGVTGYAVTAVLIGIALGTLSGMD